MTGLPRKTSRGLMLAMDTLATHLPPVSASPSPGVLKRVLVVRMDAMGDLVLFTDALKGIRRLYPSHGWELTLAVNSMWSGLLKGQGLTDHILPVQRSRFLSSLKYRYNMTRQVRSMGFDVALNPVASRSAMLGDALVRSSVAPERIGWETGTENISTAGRAISDRWYTQLVPAREPGLMELERNAMFVQYLGDADFRAGLPGLSVQPAWLREARPILERAAVGERFVVLVPGTGPPSERKWPPDRWARLAEMIVGQTAFEVVLCGSEDDKPVAREVLKRCGQAAKDLTGITSIQELAGIAAQAELLLGSDTGPVHLACALGVPSVCILGGAFPGRFFPYSVKGSDRGDATRTGPVPGVVRQGRCTCDRWNCRYLVDGMGTFPCIEGVNVEAVFREVLRAIGGTIS